LDNFEELLDVLAELGAVVEEVVDEADLERGLHFLVLDDVLIENGNEVLVEEERLQVERKMGLVILLTSEERGTLGNDVGRFLHLGLELLALQLYQVHDGNAGEGWIAN